MNEHEQHMMQQQSGGAGVAQFASVCARAIAPDPVVGVVCGVLSCRPVR